MKVGFRFGAGLTKVKVMRLKYINGDPWLEYINMYCHFMIELMIHRWRLELHLVWDIKGNKQKTTCYSISIVSLNSLTFEICEFYHNIYIMLQLKKLLLCILSWNLYFVKILILRFYKNTYEKICWFSQILQRLNTALFNKMTVFTNLPAHLKLSQWRETMHI